MKNLIRKILKESDFDWVSDVPEPGPYKKYINNFEEMVNCCSKNTKWAVALKRGGEKYFNMYKERYGDFEVIFNRSDKPKFACLSNGACYRDDDSSIDKNDINLDGWDYDSIPIK